MKDISKEFNLVSEVFNRHECFFCQKNNDCIIQYSAEKMNHARCVDFVFDEGSFTYSLIEKKDLFGINRVDYGSVMDKGNFI